MKRIPLRANDRSIREWVLVDDEDYDWLMQWKWHYDPPAKQDNTGYAQRSDCSEGRKRTIKMHRFILGAGPEVDVDHRNRNGLDNQRDNLRICTASQNHGNEGLSRNNTSGYKGVSWQKNVRRWEVRFYDGPRRRHIGFFDSAEEAARAYDSAAMEKWGEFARLNFPAASGSVVA